MESARSAQRADKNTIETVLRWDRWVLQSRERSELAKLMLIGVRPSLRNAVRGWIARRTGSLGFERCRKQPRWRDNCWTEYLVESGWRLFFRIGTGGGGFDFRL